MEGNLYIEALRQLLLHLRDEDRGVTTVEYAVMLVLIAITVAAFGSGLSGTVTLVFSRLIKTLVAVGG